MSIEPPPDNAPLGGDEEIEAILRESFKILDDANLQELETKVRKLAKLLNKNPEQSRERLESYVIEHQEVGEAQLNKLLRVLYEQADPDLRKALFSKYDQAVELCRSLNLPISEKEICLNEEARIQLAKAYVKHNVEDALIHIHLFGITNQNALIEMAQYCAQQNGGATARNIYKFGITDQNSLIAIAKLCAQQSTQVTIWSLSNFNITDQNALIEIAKLCAQQDGGATARNIQSFGIKDQNSLIIIAKLCAQQNTQATIWNLSDFNITDPTALIEIAKLCAQQNGGETAENIRNFNITDPTALIEIAKLCAQQNGDITAKNIRNFNITDPTALIEIAKLCAQQNGDITAKNIRNFNITDQTALMEIAKLCAQQICSLQEARFITTDIHNYGITDQNTLIEIAKLCAQKDGEATARNIRNFGVNDITQLSIFSLCALQNPRALQWLPEPLAPLSSIFKMDISESWNQTEAEIFLKEFIDRFHPNCGMEWMFPYLAQIHDDYAQRTVTLFFASALFILGERLSEDQLRFLNKQQLIQAVFTLKAPSLYLSLISALTELAVEDRIETLFNQIPDLRKLEKYRHFTKLIRLFLGGLQVQGIPGDLVSKFVKHCETRALHIALKNSSNAQSLITTLAYLVSCRVLTAEEKGRLLDILASSNPHKFINTLSLIKIIFNLGESYLLKEFKEDELTEIVIRAAQRHIEIQAVRNFEEQYAKTFDASRRPQAFWEYVAKMEQLHDPAIRKSLSLLFNSILTETFHEVRYDLERNPHLKALSEKHPDLLAHWRPASATPISPQDSNGIRVIQTDHPFDLLLSGTEVQGSCQNIDGDPNLNKCLLGYIMNGQNLLIAAVGQDGKIRARALLRLLWDGEQPVLLLERCYGMSTYHSAIIKSALEKAETMGLTLTCSKFEFSGLKDSVYPNPLSSLGGIAPYDYSDIKEGGVVDSNFSIREDLCRIDPEKVREMI